MRVARCTPHEQLPLRERYSRCRSAPRAPRPMPLPHCPAARRRPASPPNFTAPGRTLEPSTLRRPAPPNGSRVQSPCAPVGPGASDTRCAGQTLDAQVRHSMRRMRRARSSPALRSSDERRATTTASHRVPPGEVRSRAGVSRPPARVSAERTVPSPCSLAESTPDALRCTWCCPLTAAPAFRPGAQAARTPGRRAIAVA